jgi:phenylalanyl-tRNA synthetase beta chain
MNNSLTKAEYAENFDFIDAAQTVTLLNPLSKELQNIRQSLLLNGLENIIHNINHGTTDIKLYEFGTIYSKNANVDKTEDITKQFSEQKRLTICVTGKIQAESWQIKQSDVDFYYLKNIVQNAMNRVNIPLQEFNTKTESSLGALENVLQYLHRETYENHTRHCGLDPQSPHLQGMLKQVQHDENAFITIGKINDKLLKFFDIQQDVFYAEIDCGLLKYLPKKRIIYEELNRFPEVSRDLALLVDKQITYKEIEDLAFKTENKQLKSVNLFDAYEGKNIEEGKKSYAVRFILFNKEKTLSSNEINNIMDKLIAAYQKELGAVLR